MTTVFGTMSFGEFAVDGFFLLSGYLILQSWANQPQPWPFLKKRLLRIYPGFIVASIFCVFVVGPLGADPVAYFGALQGRDFLTNVVFLQPPVASAFAGTYHAVLNGSMWTISLEFACYLFVLGAGAIGALRFRGLLLAFTAVVFAAFSASKFAVLQSQDLRLAVFFLGGACYYHYRAQIRFNGYAAAAVTLLVLVSMFSWRGAEIALASIGGYAILYAATKRSAVLSRFNRLPDVSYGVYLYGWPLQKLLLWYMPSLSPWALFALAAPASLVAGAVSWYLIEKPALRFKGPALVLQEDAELTTAR